MVPSDWTPRLASAIAAALVELSPHVGTEPLVMLALDCHPWHGEIGIAALTLKEVAADSSSNDPAAMAAWRLFDFACDFDSWKQVAELGEVMKSAYYSGDCSTVAEAYFMACAVAISSDIVAEALASFTLADGFRLSVAHPDNGREFVPVGRG